MTPTYTNVREAALSSSFGKKLKSSLQDLSAARGSSEPEGAAPPSTPPPPRKPPASHALLPSGSAAAENALTSTRGAAKRGWGRYAPAAAGAMGLAAAAYALHRHNKNKADKADANKTATFGTTAANAVKAVKTWGQGQATALRGVGGLAGETVRTRQVARNTLGTNLKKLAPTAALGAAAGAYALGRKQDDTAPKYAGTLSEAGALADDGLAALGRGAKQLGAKQLAHLKTVLEHAPAAMPSVGTPETRMQARDVVGAGLQGLVPSMAIGGGLYLLKRRREQQRWRDAQMYGQGYPY